MTPCTTANLGHVLTELRRDHTNWTLATFGFDRKPWNHLVLEAQELAKRPGDISEMADVLLLLLDVARVAGIDVPELVQAACEKHAINKTRTWAPLDENGISRHVTNQTKTP